MRHHEISIEWTVSQEDSGLNLRSYLLMKKDISRRLLTDIKFAGGSLLVNNKQSTVRSNLAAGDRVKVIFPPEPVSEFIPQSSVDLSIVYEDKHLLVIDKPSGISTIPSRDRQADSVAGAVLAYYSRTAWPATFHAVNRLDKETSGLMIVAKHRYAHDQFAKKQRMQEVKRQYTALLHGEIRWFTGMIHAPIARKDSSIIERKVDESGKEAHTAFATAAVTNEASLVNVSLLTGRTHQIRVHFAWLGYPLVGDKLYGGSIYHSNAHLLHASQIAFTHPFTNEIHYFTSALPERFTTCSLFPGQTNGH
ncbi:RluA family pseudouridine synthase [Salisediminibacterium halotolerans]|uniref:Pseudouridine synthase n=1 Tax=Salisediminibacterium halotolerans TaxID=517425 RepID=A0A1H9VDM7_9BACI|nr:RluA family pseudouridine synthase [Salisediminibacterium haloalkalitolerans]SES19688.1 23S rRNA pseudouridine1911/1915/1917 synthase [Salisediminibacterium haloalkalitolerans]